MGKSKVMANVRQRECEWNELKSIIRSGAAKTCYFVQEFRLDLSLLATFDARLLAAGG
jgi:hypothetical protein